MHKKNIFNFTCKKLSMKRANVNTTRHQGCMKNAILCKSMILWIFSLWSPHNMTRKAT